MCRKEDAEDTTVLQATVSGSDYSANVLAPEDEWISKVDHDAFKEDVKNLGKQLAEAQGTDDVAHLKKIMAWTRACSVVGMATCWYAINPISIYLLSLGIMVRWTCIGHHVCHGGFDKCSKGEYSRFKFGVGSLYRRCVDWLDWMLVEAWNTEHNQLHHYHLGESGDPDLVERNLELIRDMPRWTAPLKYAAVLWMMVTWKWFYYSPNTFKMLKINEARRRGQPLNYTEKEMEEPCVILSWSTGLYRKFFTNVEFFGRVLGPFFVGRFVATPALAAAAVYAGATALAAASAPADLARAAAISCVINLALGELLTNAWAFLVVATNHCGSDLYRFEGHATPRSPSFYLRQTISSVNFRTGGAEGGFVADLVDFSQGWLNYQIEHHLWPDLSMRSYQKAQPLVKAICKKHGVPYFQEHVFTRLGRTVDIIVGNTTMRRFPTAYHHVPDIS
jgi:fatty acid desaturase